MSTTANLNLPLLATQQSQKEVVINQAFTLIDSAVSQNATDIAAMKAGGVGSSIDVNAQVLAWLS